MHLEEINKENFSVKKEMKGISEKLFGRIAFTSGDIDLFMIWVYIQFLYTILKNKVAASS